MGTVIPFPAQGGDQSWADLFDPGNRPRPELLPPRETRVTYVVRVDLDDAQPPIWRRLRLTSDLDLETLHLVLQVAMGWTNSHLHHFQMGPDTKDFQMMPFGTDYDEESDWAEDVHERDVRLDQVLAKPGQRLFYEYDFGDGWQHTIRLEKVEPWQDDSPDALCVEGRRACPPEDVGGIGGYEETLAALRGEPGPDPEWTKQLLDWLPPGYDPEHFDVDEVNKVLARPPLDLDAWHPGLTRLLRQPNLTLSPLARLIFDATAEAVELTEEELLVATHRYRHLVAAVGEGVKLTQAGYLPPAVVSQLFDDLGLEKFWRSAGNREVQTLPVLTLRQSATDLGLLRKQHGKLLPTAAGRRLADDAGRLFEHIRSRLPLGRRDSDQDAGLLALLYAAGGHDLYDQLESAAEAFGSLGWQSSVSLQQALWYSAAPTRDVLDHLIGRPANPGTRTRIARALISR
ncbi:MAG: plasmid pRiA4b ORF-3 family protein [Brooklawnia sp.]|jgi:hypothetical protein